MITLKQFRKLFGEVVAVAAQRGDPGRQCMKEIESIGFSKLHFGNPYTTRYCVETKGHNGPHKGAEQLRDEEPKTNRRGLVAHSRAQG